MFGDAFSFSKRALLLVFLLRIERGETEQLLKVVATPATLHEPVPPVRDLPSVQSVSI